MFLSSCFKSWSQPHDIYSTCCYSKLKCHTGDFTWFQSNCTKRDWISYSCWQIRILSWWSQERSVQAFIHMIVQCALRCCATCIGTALNKCWIEAIELLSFTISEQKLFQPRHDACFCRRMFHPPLLASNCFLFSSVKTGVSIQLVVSATFCFATRNTLLDFSATAQNEIGFPIRVDRFVFYPGLLMKGQYMGSSTWLCSVLWDVVLLVLVLL